MKLQHFSYITLSKLQHILSRFHKHRKEWNEKQASIQEKRQATIPETKYQHDYKYKDIRPRSTKKPPPSPRDPYPPPMNFDTNQRRDFTPKDVSVRASLIQPVSSALKKHHVVSSGYIYEGGIYAIDL